MRRLLALAVAACTEPTITEYEERNGIVTGTVLLRPPESSDPCAPLPGGGNAIITLFRADAPPPPRGSSGPVNFIVVPERALFEEGRQANGVFAAPFVIPTVEPGQYTVRGFLDADRDFHPTVDLLAQPTAGDIGGAYVDPETLAILPIDVAADRATSQVTVSLGLPIPAERPAFAITSTPSFTVPFAAPTVLILESHPINTTDIAMAPECTRFLVSYVDDDADGAADDQNGDHLPDLYPRVILRLRGRGPGEPAIIVPAILNPFPFVDRLAAAPAVPATLLELIVPPVAVERGPMGDRILEAIPPGEYETIVISGTGQTWQVPNNLALQQPADPDDPTQRQVLAMVEGPALPAGSISGTLRTAADAEGDVYVIAFSAADPPPPAGTGRPKGLATVRRSSFVAGAGGREAPFTIRGLASETYVVVAVLDADGSLSPLVDLVAQPSAGDVGGRAAAPVTVSAGDAGAGVIDLDTPFAFDRPAFEMDAPSIPRTGFPRAVETRAHAIAALGIDAGSARVPVALQGTDLEGDNLPDLYPRVILSRLAEGDPRTAPNDGVLIPGIVDPLPYLSQLGGGAPFVPSDGLRIILPPVALVPGASGFEEMRPPPPGRYRVNVLSATGQTWSVPNELDAVLGRAGGPNEDLTQGSFIVVEDSPVPGGVITGTIRLLTAEPAGDYQVVVLVFSRDAPPPPRGSGRPLAVAIVGKPDFVAGTAPFTAGGLATGVYQIRAFLDRNDDFVPWFDAMNQPNAGDVGGGYVTLPQGALRDVTVDALGPPITGIEVSILDPAAVPTDRPSFWVPSPSPVLEGAPISVPIQALVETTDVFTTNGVFPIQWIDLDGNGTADDVNGDGNPDVFPIVVAELLDPGDEENLTVAVDPVRVPGLLNPAQFAPLGFPAADPTQVALVVAASTVTVVFPPAGVRGDPPVSVAPPAGRYRITLINPAGQTWTIPNELERARGTPFEVSQAGYLTVR
jgi:hypothetical protein